MSEDSRVAGSSGTPAGANAAGQDLGFFTSAGAPTVSVTPPAPYGALPDYGRPPVHRTSLPVWAVVAIVACSVMASVVVLGILAAIAIPVFLNQRSTPVMPDSIRGVTRSTDPDLTATAAHARDRMRQENPGAKIDAAGYGTSESGYVLIGANLRLNPAQEFGSLGAADRPMSFGTTQCATDGQSHVSLCLHVGTRGSVELLALGGSDLSELALETGTAWSKQPFGRD